MTNPILNQNGFRFYEDDSGWNDLELENADHARSDNTKIILRIELEVTNTKSLNNRIGTVYADKKGAGYAVLNQARADGLAMVVSSWFTDGDADNNDRLATSSLTFTGGELDDDGAHGEVSGGMDFAGQDHWEIGMCIQIDTGVAVDGDYWDIQLKDDIGGDIDGYTRTPRITYNEAVTRRIFLTHV